MRCIGRCAVLGVLLGLMAMAVWPAAQDAAAQDKEAAEKEAPKKEAQKDPPVPPAKVAAPAKTGAAAAGAGYAKLAPGVVITIPPENQKAEEVTIQDLLRLQRMDPNFGERQNPAKQGSIAVSNLSKDVRLKRAVWCLEFNFKSMRMIEVDVPRPGAKFDRKMIWYMPYFVRLLPPGKNKAQEGNEPAKEEGAEAAKAEADAEPGDPKPPKEVKFLPRFLLESDQKVKTPDGREIAKSYMDRLIPVAMAPIRLREDPKRVMLNSVEIGEKPIQLSTDTLDNAVWGVAMWEDIDPKTVKFKVYVQGLTNAYEIKEEKETDVDGKEAKRWQYRRKTLILHFWRPADDAFETDREIRYGWPEKLEKPERGKGQIDPSKLEHAWDYK